MFIIIINIIIIIIIFVFIIIIIIISIIINFIIMKRSGNADCRTIKNNSKGVEDKVRGKG